MQPDFISDLARRGHLLRPEAARLLSSDEVLRTLLYSALREGQKLPSLISPDDLWRLKGSYTTLNGGIEVISDPTEYPVRNAEIEGFLSLFRSRYETLSKILRRNKPEAINTPGIPEALKDRGRDVGFIAMVREVRTSRNGNLIMSLEDGRGEVTGILMKRNMEKVNPLPIEDEVVAVVGDFHREKNIVFVKEVHRPDISRQEMKTHLSRDEEYLLITSDTHVGSKTFMKKEWNTFISWLNFSVNVEGLSEEITERVKHLLIAGDLVDGVGIYKDQDRDLEIVNIMEQYEALAAALSTLPTRMNVILIPGNHDAVRILEPQPALPKEVRNLFPSRFLFLGSPSLVSIKGVKVLAYHGRSLDDLICRVPGASYKNPIVAQMAMLKMRHLCPIYGGRTPMAPLERDLLTIEEVPNIFVSGHVHRFEVEVYRGVVVVQASAWQSQTEYQVMRNIQPEPARAALVGLHDLSVRELDFSGKRPRARLIKPPVKLNG